MRSRHTSPPFLPDPLDIRIALLPNAQPPPARQTNHVRLQARNSLTMMADAGYGRRTDFIDRAPPVSTPCGGPKTDFAKSVFLCPESYARVRRSTLPCSGSTSRRAVYTRTKRGRLLDSYTTIKSRAASRKVRNRHVVLTPCGDNAIWARGHVAPAPHGDMASSLFPLVASRCAVQYGYIAMSARS